MLVLDAIDQRAATQLFDLRQTHLRINTIQVSATDHYRSATATHIAANESAVDARDLSLRVFHCACVVAVIREQQQSLRIEIQTALVLQITLDVHGSNSVQQHNAPQA